MRRGPVPLLSFVVPVVLLAAACGGDDAGGGDGQATVAPGASSAPVGDCPAAKVPVVVTVEQWGDIVAQLAGACGEVTTIVKGTAVDPHDFEPSPADTRRFGEADLVVLNGAGYDEWAEKAIDSLGSEPAVVDAAEVVGKAHGDNPHLWYGPAYVEATAQAVTAELRRLRPAAAGVFDQLAATWAARMRPYDDEIAALEGKAAGKTYAATESVFDYLAQAVGLLDATPEGYRNAAANESEPAPADIAGFEEALRAGRVDVLVYNSQTEGAVPEQLKDVAEAAKVPVVEVTETVGAGAEGFVEWQISQLEALSRALD